jgi:hypothetical protein
MHTVALERAGILLCLLVTAVVSGCIQVPGLPWAVTAPEPVVGQWIAGEAPQTEFHMIFYENGTYLYAAYYLTHGGQIVKGNWTKTGPGQYTAQSTAGNATVWIYDPSADSVHISGMPLIRYSRYKG